MAVEKIRENVKYVKASQVRIKKFVEPVAQVSLDKQRGLSQDVSITWNSTILMLQDALYYRRAFLRLMSDSNYKHCPAEKEWDRVEDISKFLEVFYNATCIFSGTKYPTANLYLSQAFMVQQTFAKVISSSNVFVSSMASRMYSKVEKYWSEYSTILALLSSQTLVIKFGLLTSVTVSFMVQDQ